VERVISYIDGFNLYFGLKSKGYRRYYWLNIQQLSRSLLKNEQLLSHTKYFTSRVSSVKSDPEKSKRQASYIEAVETLNDCSIFYGHYLSKKVVCHTCRKSWQTHEEKMTDVNIAVELMTDAFQNQFDTALLLSGDSDLKGPVKSVRDLFPNKRVIVAFPPDRHSRQLGMAANAFFTIGRKKLADSQFPDVVVKADGFNLVRPKMWR
jgi:uncharacterized LabA/DUF88 family protein